MTRVSVVGEHVTPTEFRQRFLGFLPDAREEFIKFDKERAAALQISETDRLFLTESGLPRRCAPFLSFAPYGNSALDAALEPLENFPNAVTIGSNGSGDSICLDQDAGGAVVCFNHNFHMKRVLMNSSLAQFAESVCEFAAFLRSKNIERLRERISSIDPAPEALQFWMSEAAMEVDGDD